MATAYEAVIGLEVHAQLLTQSKMFCSCRAHYRDLPPNSNNCPVCLGLPGSLPVINRRAVELTIRTALALNCEIPEFTKFDRKNYFYPDLPKGYQISQYDLPLSRAGWLTVEVGGTTRRAGITRVHLEEDTGTLHHEGDELHTASFSLVDLDRAGVPLMEIVGEPDLRSPEEAAAYLEALRRTLIYLGVNDGSLEHGSMRCDANISLRPEGQVELGVKVEIKNLNSFRSLRRSLEFEINRQTALLDQGQAPTQETRGWSEKEQATVHQRSKEQAQEYRYFPEPDLPPLLISREMVEALRGDLPELPEAKLARLMSEYGLGEENARLLADRPDDARYFEAVVAEGVRSQLAANWQLGELMGLCNAAHQTVAECKVEPATLAALLVMVESSQISNSAAKEVLARLFEAGGEPEAVVDALGLRQLSDSDQLSALVEQVLNQQPKAAADYRSGNDRALGSLVGAVMAASKGKANPQVVNRLLRERLPREVGTS